MSRARCYNQYKPWPRVRVELPTGYVEVSYDWVVHGPQKKVRKFMTLAKKCNGWKLVMEPK